MRAGEGRLRDGSRVVWKVHDMNRGGSRVKGGLESV